MVATFKITIAARNLDALTLLALVNVLGTGLPLWAEGQEFVVYSVKADVVRCQQSKGGKAAKFLSIDRNGYEALLSAGAIKIVR